MLSEPTASPPLDVSALIYCARSGSTFLAFRLAEAEPRIAVIPEFRLPLLLMWKPEDAVRRLDAAKLLELMHDDVQIGNLEIPASALPELANRLVGGSTRSILEGVLRAHLEGAGQPHCRHVLLKNSEFALNGPRVREVFPEIRALHIRRDPRGVANSMISAKRSYDSGSMAHGNVVYAARIWMTYISRTEALDWPVREIGYEDMLAAPEAEAAAAAQWLLETAGQPDGTAPGGPVESERAFRVGDAEQGLHRLAAGDAAPARKEAWRSELPTWQIEAIEAVAGEAMIARGYTLDHARPNGAPPTLSLTGRFWHLRKETEHYLGALKRLVVWGLTDQRRARVRMRQFVNRQLGRN